MACICRGPIVANTGSSGLSVRVLNLTLKLFPSGNKLGFCHKRGISLTLKPSQIRHTLLPSNASNARAPTRGGLTPVPPSAQHPGADHSVHRVRNPIFQNEN